uniref:Uncharacterized protein n=1 Tax=viral metagenome TaxID=1070528 RepID=A0A6M3K3N6_9ZZZZ
MLEGSIYDEWIDCKRTHAIGQPADNPTVVNDPIVIKDPEPVKAGYDIDPRLKPVFWFAICIAIFYSILK